MICQATASPAPAQDVTHRILVGGWWARFTFNGITRCECCGADGGTGDLSNLPALCFRCNAGKQNAQAWVHNRTSTCSEAAWKS